MLNLAEKTEATNGYLAIADFIESQIVSGALKYDEKLPDTTGLMELFQVSRDTIQRSLTRLSNKGLVKRAPRRGTFVTARLYSRDIALLLGKNPFFDPSSFYFTLLTEFNNLAKDYQFTPKVYYILDEDNPFQTIQDLEHDLKEGKLKCLIPVFMSSFLGRWLEHWDDMPIIFPAGEAFSDGVYQGIKHLIQKGYKKIHTISTVSTADEKHDFVVRLRKSEIDGIKQAVNELNPEFEVANPVYCGNTEAEAYHHIKEVFHDRETAPDAIFVNHDIMTRGVLMALLELGVGIPEEVALITHFNKGYNLFSPIKLTKLQFDPKDHVIKTLDYLKQNTFNLPGGRQWVPGDIEPTIIQGQST